MTFDNQRLLAVDPDKHRCHVVEHISELGGCMSVLEDDFIQLTPLEVLCIEWTCIDSSRQVQARIWLILTHVFVLIEGLLFTHFEALSLFRKQFMIALGGHFGCQDVLSSLFWVNSGCVVLRQADHSVCVWLCLLEVFKHGYEGSTSASPPMVYRSRVNIRTWVYNLNNTWIYAEPPIFKCRGKPIVYHSRFSRGIHGSLRRCTWS